MPDIEKGKEIIKSLMDWLEIEETEATKETPERVAKMYLEVFSGLYKDFPVMKLFDANQNYICVTDISFTSFCEHHLLPFYGKCGVVYFSDGKKVLGLSKIPRIVEYCSSRPSIQERLTEEIAERIMEIDGLNAKGVYVSMVAEHSCMTIRGIKAVGSRTSTASLMGEIDKEEAIKLLTLNNFFTK